MHFLMKEENNYGKIHGDAEIREINRARITYSRLSNVATVFAQDERHRHHSQV